MNRLESSEVRTGSAGRLGVGLIMLALTVGVSACGGSGNAASSTKATPATLTITTPPAAGDIDKVNWALPKGEPSTLDPVKTGDYSPNTVVLNMCEPLMALQPDFSVKPGLAENVTQPDSKTMVFTIRRGVTFWDGTPLTAADVAFSLQRNLDPRNTPVGGALFRSVAAIKATGPLQVTVTFVRHDAQFLNTMASVSSAISEKAFVERAGKNYGSPRAGVMCTGPFKFGKWAAGDRIVLARNDQYWSTKAKAKEFDFVFFTDDSTLTSALLAGQIDGTYEAPLGSIDTLRKASGGKLYYGPSTQSLSIGPVSATGPAADPRVRRALDLAIDKPSLIKNVLHGAGSPLRTFTPQLTWAGDPAKAVYDQGYQGLPDNAAANLAQAKSLIAQAAPATKNLTMVIPSGDQLSLQTATIVQADAHQIGLTISIKQMQPTSFSELFYDPTKRAGIDLIVASGYIEVPGAYYYAPGFVLKDGPFNWTGWSDPQVSKLMTDGQQATDPQVAAKDFVAAQAIFGPADLQISLASLNELLYLNNKITGAPASFAYISSAWAASVGKSQ
ncbi:ABC transporter substrate-binding protein [Jatrophihabitans telluris]|uniref:ABC transporter substrate-binding protein n=1 Tax=Jatrophihabitans telluris TaxID=2038343 RepID=A0ABY4QZQ7_9ACTN|nr:ABC transporter substrate-binding protein [Jatrophihabitans telluris]UQX89003.1 ABC transporter substrate-binding protein [Jatrophihabitans telluris]